MITVMRSGEIVVVMTSRLYKQSQAVDNSPSHCPLVTLHPPVMDFTLYNKLSPKTGNLLEVSQLFYHVSHVVIIVPDQLVWIRRLKQGIVGSSLISIKKNEKSEFIYYTNFEIILKDTQMIE